MKKIVVILLLIVAIGAGLILWRGATSPVLGGERVPVLGILQTASHPALDRAREHFTKRARDLWGGKIDFLVFNAEGSAASAQIMADELHRDAAVIGIVTIGTLATQAMARTERSKPIIMTAVSDPESIGVLRSGGNICGTSDATDVARLIEVLRVLVPGARRVALLHNPAEPNSVAVVKRLEVCLAGVGLIPVRSGAMSESELPLVIDEALRSTDVLIVPPDNMVAQALPLVGRCAWDQKRVVLVFDPLLLMKGVLATVGGADYASLGRETADIAYHVLVGRVAPSSVPIKIVADAAIRVHRETARHLGIEVPDAIREQVILG